MHKVLIMKDKRRKYDMRCLKCGYANQMSARFCVNCGSRLGIESAKKNTGRKL